MVLRAAPRIQPWVKYHLDWGNLWTKIGTTFWAKWKGLDETRDASLLSARVHRASHKFSLWFWASHLSYRPCSHFVTIICDVVFCWLRLADLNLKYGVSMYLILISTLYIIPIGWHRVGNIYFIYYVPIYIYKYMIYMYRRPCQPLQVPVHSAIVA